MKRTASGTRALEMERELYEMEKKIKEFERGRGWYLYQRRDNPHAEDEYQAELQPMIKRRKELEAQIPDLKKNVPFEAISVRQNPFTRYTKKGEERTYYRWVASWREGKKTRVVYLGSVNKVTEEEALKKAIELKKKAWEITDDDRKKIKELWDFGNGLSEIYNSLRKQTKPIDREIDDMLKRKEIRYDPETEARRDRANAMLEALKLALR